MPAGMIFPMEYQGKEEDLFYAKIVSLVVSQRNISCGDGFC